MTGSTMRWMLMPCLLVACGKKEQDFDVEAYCAESVDCVNADRPGYGSTGFQITEDECIFQWESERDIYTDAGCGTQWDAMEYCFGNEELSCIYGSWGSTACLSEIRDLQECVQENVFNTSAYD